MTRKGHLDEHSSESWFTCYCDMLVPLNDDDDDDDDDDMFLANSN